MKLSFKTFIWILLAFGVISSINSVRKPETDFRAYYLAGKRIWAKTIGEKAFDTYGIAKNYQFNPEDTLFQDDLTAFKYTPVIAYIFLPFSFFPMKVAQLLWFGFCFSLLFFSLYLIHKNFKEEFFKEDRTTFWFFTLLFIFQFRFYFTDFKNQQVNFLILFCFIGFLCFWKKRENLSAFLLALLVGIKLFPIFLFVFLLIEKRFRLIGKTILAGGILLILPILSYKGIDPLIAEYQNYFTFMTNGQHAFPAPANFKHPNIDSLIVRLFMDRPYHHDLKTNIFNWDPKSTFWLINFLKITILAGIVAIQLKFKKNIEGKNQELYNWAMIGLYSNYILIINPLNWKHGLVTLTIPWVVIGLLWIKNQGFVKKEKILFGLSIILLLFTSHIIWGELQRSLLGKIGQDFWGIVFLSILLIQISKRTLVTSNETKF